MVRILNGELVPDDDPRLARSASTSQSGRTRVVVNRPLFPPTNGMFGPLSGAVTVGKLDIELVYIVGLALLCIGYDPVTAVIIGVLLALYQNGANGAAKRIRDTTAPTAPPTAANRSSKEGRHLGTLSDVRQDKM